MFLILVWCGMVLNFNLIWGERLIDRLLRKLGRGRWAFFGDVDPTGGGGGMMNVVS